MTKKQFDFKPFYKRFKKYHPTQPLPSHHFLEWFLGFVEGDGCLAIMNKHLILGEQRLLLTITLHEKDKHVLDLITTTFTFGKVYKNTNDRYIYKVTRMRDISIFIELFNGNTVVPKFYERFVHFLENYNTKVLSAKARPQTKALGSIELKAFTVSPTYDDAWFRGFADAEGCFHENLSKLPAERKQWSYYFAVYQKGLKNQHIFEHFKSMFKCGSIQRAKRGDEFVFKIISCNHSVDRVGPYFQKFGLKTVKRNAFERWLLVMAVLKQHRYRRTSFTTIYVQIVNI